MKADTDVARGGADAATDDACALARRPQTGGVRRLESEMDSSLDHVARRRTEMVLGDARCFFNGGGDTDTVYG